MPLDALNHLDALAFLLGLRPSFGLLSSRWVIIIIAEALEVTHIFTELIHYSFVGVATFIELLHHSVLPELRTLPLQLSLFITKEVLPFLLCVIGLIFLRLA